MKLVSSFATLVGQPTPLYKAAKLSAADLARKQGQGYGCDDLAQREDLLHTGAHKINNTLGQGLLTRRMGSAGSSRRRAPVSTALRPPPRHTWGLRATSTWGLKCAPGSV